MQTTCQQRPGALQQVLPRRVDLCDVEARPSRGTIGAMTPTQLRHLALLCSTLALLGTTTLAWAQEPSAETNMQVEEADALVAQERYTDAAPIYEGLFATTRDSEFLFKAGAAFAKAGNANKAQALFQQYLAVAPDGAHSKAAYAWIARLSPNVGDAEQHRNAEDAARRTREEAAQRESRRLAEQAWLAAHPEHSERFYARQRSRRRLGLVVTASGLVALGIGVGFAVVASGQSDSVSGATTWSQAWEDEAAAGERNETIANVCIFGGAAVALTGVVLYWRGRGGKPTVPRDAVALRPVVGADRAGLALAGGF